MLEPRQLEIDQAQDDLRRRDGMTERDRPARCDGRHRGRGVAVGRAPLGEDGGDVVEHLFAGHALASPVA